MTGARGRVEGGLVVIRENIFLDAEIRILARVGNAYGHACSALRAPIGKRTEYGFLTNRAKWAIGIIAVTVLLSIPFPMTVLSEARIAPAYPVLITAPLNAVIKKIHIEPNTLVKKDTPLFAFDKTELKSSAKGSDKRVRVLLADRARAEQKGFSDAQSRAELSLIAARLAQA